jgi:hypothetical protein
MPHPTKRIPLHKYMYTQTLLWNEEPPSTRGLPTLIVQKTSTLQLHFLISMTLLIGFIIILVRLCFIFIGISNVHTQDFIKILCKSFMENQCLWFIKKKMIIHLTKLMPKYLQMLDICDHFTQKNQYLVGLVHLIQICIPTNMCF